jgi:ParB family transcriptional regulator, chromosome partitioning protein
MARKRLTAPQDIYLAHSAPSGLTPPFSTAPIAMIAGEATAVSALRQVAGAMEAARVEGRLIQSLPLDAVEVGHLIRDRITKDSEEMAALRDSLRSRGQQQPIDVVDLGAGRYGLISGWRRLTALKELYAETGEERFGHVQALLRRPDGASDAYLAMVEENEIRANLSHYERARIVALAAEQGVFKSPQEALRHLFANASRAKRSKIGSFVILHQELGSVLAFPAAIPERLGLALAQAMGDTAAGTAPAPPGFAVKLRDRLAKAQPQSAEAEVRLLTSALKGNVATPVERVKRAVTSLKTPKIRLETVREGKDYSLILSGPDVTPAFAMRLAIWLKRHLEGGNAEETPTEPVDVSRAKH